MDSTESWYKSLVFKDLCLQTSLVTSESFDHESRYYWEANLFQEYKSFEEVITVFRSTDCKNNGSLQLKYVREKKRQEERKEMEMKLANIHRRVSQLKSLY